MIKCGMCEVNITPPLGLTIPGYLTDRKSTGIKDELFAKAMVLDDGERMVALIALDVLDLQRKEVIKIRDRVFESVGIPQANIMISATHTHTGPPVVSSWDYQHDEEYIAYLIKKASDAVVIAYQKRKSAMIGCGVGIEKEIAFNRRFFMKDGSVRTNPGIQNPLIDRAAGPIDPDVTVIRIEDLEGNPMGVVTNYACHLDVVGGTEYSADYPGELSRTVRKVLGPKVISIFLTGACGNINHADVSGNMELTPGHYGKIGRILAGEVLKVWNKAKMYDDIKVDVRHTAFSVGTRYPSEEDIQKAEAFLKLSSDDWIEQAFAKELLVFAKSREKSVELEVQVMKVGPFSIVGLPGEIFVEFGLDVKNQSPFQFTMVNTLANGANGYVPTKEAFEQGGYEPRLARSSKLLPEAGYKMVLSAVEIMNDLYNYPNE